MGARGDVHGWGGLWLRRGPLALGLVPQVGGRIMSLRWRERELAWVHPAHRGARLDVGAAADLSALRRRVGFVHWGGDKTWLAPQERWPDAVAFLDLDAGVWTATPSGAGAVAMTSPVCRETGMRITRVVALGDADGVFTVTHVLENAGRAPATWGAWDVQQLAAPGVAFLPRRTAGSAFADGVKAYAAEGDSEGLRATVLRPLGDVVAIDCATPRWCKYGADADEGWVLGVQRLGDVHIAHVKAVVPDPARRWGHGCAAEVFCAVTHPYFELEVHGPLATLAPGERAICVERRWVGDVDAVPATRDAVRALVARATSACASLLR
ncbi:MAG: hypothetical protein KIT14_20910 [bacterium]|nr:hypothetical protein [bacterium]